MAASAPPLADTRKPPSQPPAGQQAAVDKATAQSGGPSQAKPAAPPAQAAASQQRFDRMAVRAKLAVSQPGDAAEREAEQVAEQVGRKAVPDETASPGGHASPPRPAHVGERIARRAAATPPDLEATAEETGGAGEGGSALRLSEAQGRIRQLSGQGDPLPASLRARMEAEFAHDFSRVRIHHDANAHELCRSLNALAFTTGDDIFFAAGQYRPASAAGIRLLAHELTHVVQGGPGIARKIAPDIDPKYTPKNAKTNEAALKALGRLDLPAVKRRHLPLYNALLPDKLRRKKGYKRGNPNQVNVWNKGVKIADSTIRQRLKARKVESVPTSSSEAFKFTLGTDKKVKSWSIEQLQKKLQIPTWSRHGKEVGVGKGLGTGFQVDHILELQVSGEDGTGTANSLQNMELLDQPSNSSSGGAIRAGIYTKVDAYLATFKAPGPKRRDFLKKHDIVFESVQVQGGMGAKEGDSSWWTYQEIVDAVPLDQVKAAPPSDEEGSAKEFLLASGPNGVVVQRLARKPGQKTIAVSGSAQGAIAGIKMDSISIDESQAATGKGEVGSISGVWNLPTNWKAADTKITLKMLGDGKYRGYPSKLGQKALDFGPMSPVELGDVSVEDGALAAEGNLTPTLPLFNRPITVQLRGEDIRFALVYSAEDLSLPAPLGVDDASISVFYSTREGLGIEGDLLFTLDKVGGGELKASYTQAKGVALEGRFDFASELFDTAQVKAWWRRDEGFGASGVLAITEAGKVKGIKSAHLDALYEKGVFSATGNAETDIPGLKGFKAEAKFVDEDNFSVTGSGDFEKLPGIESGALTLTLERIGGDWALAGKGHAVPALPGGAKGNIDASYDKGVVLLRGNVHFNYGGGLLDGDVTVAVTNAAGVAPDGSPSGEAGPGYQVFGEGTLTAALIKDRLDGTLRLRLLPDGSVRVGGAITARDFEVFPKYPKDGGEFFNKDFSTPPVPLPGLGFSVGSVSVGITFSATLTLKAHAAIGPGRLTGISLGVEEFDPANVDFNTLKFTGGGTFVVYADAGFSASAALNLIFGAAIAELVGSVGAEAAAGIPADQPVLSAHADFTFSRNDGLDLEGTMNLNIAPELKFRLFGSVSARLNLLIDTITVWKKDWTLAEANYKLPVGINATGTLGYNSKTGRIRPENPADAIRIDRPRLDGDAMQGVLMGHSAPPQVDNRPTGRGSTPEQPVLHRKPAATGGDGMRRLPTRAFASGAPIAFADA